MQKKFSIVATLALILCSPLIAAERQFAGEITELTLRSEILDEDRDIIVRLPLDYRYQKRASYPVLYVLDGGIQTSHTTGTISYLHEYNQIPDLIVVAINNTNRTRDMTPSPKEDFEDSGGAAGFLGFIESELMPFINRNYRDNGFNMIAGHSFGGLFVFNTLLERPDLFDVHFAFSPSLWWEPDDYFARLETYFQSNPDYSSFLYTNLGSEAPSMAPPFERLQKLLENHAPAGLEWYAKIYPDEVHVSTPVLGQFEALRLFFRDWPLSTQISYTSSTEIEAHYDKISNTLGYEVLPDERLLNRAADLYFNFRDDPDLARQLLQLSIDTYPESPHAYALMADYALQEGQPDEAMNWIEKALALIDPADGYFERYEEQRKEIDNERSPN